MLGGPSFSFLSVLMDRYLKVKVVELNSAHVSSWCRWRWVLHLSRFGGVTPANSGRASRGKGGRWCFPIPESQGCGVGGSRGLEGPGQLCRMVADTDQEGSWSFPCW